MLFSLALAWVRFSYCCCVHSRPPGLNHVVTPMWNVGHDQSFNVFCSNWIFHQQSLLKYIEPVWAIFFCRWFIKISDHKANSMVLDWKIRIVFKSHCTGLPSWGAATIYNYTYTSKTFFIMSLTITLRKRLMWYVVWSISETRSVSSWRGSSSIRTNRSQPTCCFFRGSSPYSPLDVTYDLRATQTLGIVSRSIYYYRTPRAINTRRRDESLSRAHGLQGLRRNS